MRRHTKSLLPLLAVYFLLNQFILGDDSVQFDWVNSTNLQATIGADIVSNETKLNIVVCYFDDKDRRFVFCNPNAVQINSDPLLNPFGTGNARNLTYGIWLRSPTNVWVDKIFGIPFSPRDVTSFAQIIEYSFIDDSEYNMKIQPVSADFPQMTMMFYLACQNDSVYNSDEMDLTEYAASGRAADYAATIASGLSLLCNEACAEIYIRATERNTQQQHKFRVGAVCHPLRKTEKNEAIEMFVLKIRIALNEFLHTVIPQPVEYQ